MTIVIRPAAEGDLIAVGQVHARARAAAYEGIVPAEALDAFGAGAMGEWWTQRWIYEGDTHRMAVACDPTVSRDAAWPPGASAMHGGPAPDGAIVGFTYVGPSPVPGTGELYAIHVDPARQGGGIGRALMSTALRTLGQLGESRAVLWVLTGNATARRFYERGGWRSDGARREAPLGAALTPQIRYARKVEAVDGLRPDGST